MKKVLAVLLFVISMSTCAFSAERAVQVTQPAYRSMKFYVYKPVNVPREFYVTFDGYLVYRNSKGVWNYGSAEKSGIVKTDYVVGAVIPSVVRLKPYNVHISSVAPLLGSAKENTAEGQAAESSVQPTKSARIIYMPPASGLELYSPQTLSPNNPDWTQNSNFMAIGKWQNSIDRIGVTYRPMMPVAWKGDYPEVIYAWTGLQWRQLNSREHTEALKTLQSGFYDLIRYARKVNMLNWTDDDTHVLSQYSVMWGYQWMGQIFLGRNY